MPAKMDRRRNGKIDRLPQQLRDEVDQMLLSGIPYREIVEYLQNAGVSLSRQSVCNYARKFLATTQMLRIAQENFRMMTDEIDNNPNLDTSEGIIRVMSNAMLNTLANATPEDWNNVNMDKLLREANSLVRVTAHKRRVDAQNQTEMERAITATQNITFNALAKNYPGLYRQLAQALQEMQNRGLTDH